MSVRTCETCANSAKRFRGTRPRLWCMAYKQPADIPGGCIDHKARTTVAAALNHLKRTSLK